MWWGILWESRRDFGSVGRPFGHLVKYAVRLDFSGCTNNVAEYEGLLLSLRKARALGVRRLLVKSDSELVTGHVDKSYKAQHPELVKYLAAVKGMEKYFLGFLVSSFSRALNKEVDELSKAVAQQNPLPPDIFFETLKHGSIHSIEVLIKFKNAITSEDWSDNGVSLGTLCFGRWGGRKKNGPSG
jgi:ribonuclease HI